MKKHLRFVGLTKEIEKCLTDNWQTSALIASQIVFPPDAIVRRIAHHGSELTAAGAKTSLVGQCIANMVKRGRVERRRIHGAKYEYRLLKPSQPEFE